MTRRIEAGDPERRPLTLDDPERLRLVFPMPGMVIERGEDEAAPLAFSVAGGRRPLTWILDGRPLAVTVTGRDLDWQPDGPGFSRLTVIDADGRSASAGFEVR